VQWHKHDEPDAEIPLYLAMHNLFLQKNVLQRRIIENDAGFVAESVCSAVVCPSEYPPI